MATYDAQIKGYCEDKELYTCYTHGQLFLFARV